MSVRNTAELRTLCQKMHLSPELGEQIITLWEKMPVDRRPDLEKVLEQAQAAKEANEQKYQAALGKIYASFQKGVKEIVRKYSLAFRQTRETHSRKREAAKLQDLENLIREA